MFFNFNIAGGKKMVGVVITRRAVDGPRVSKCNGPAGRRLFTVWRLGGPLMARSDPS